MTQRLKTFYLEKVFPKLQEKYNYTNVHQIPKVEKIVINRGLGEASQNTKLVETSVDEITTISGQKAVVNRSTKAIAGFKIREGAPVGISVTLRGERLYAFLDRLINLALPRIRDFQGLSPMSFDGRGNYSFGLQEQLMFPEIEYDKVDKSRGMDITISTSAKNDEEAFFLLQSLGMPFRGDLSSSKRGAGEGQKGRTTQMKGGRGKK